MLTCELRDEAGGRVLWDLKLIVEPQTFRIRTELDIGSGAALMLGTERAGASWYWWCGPAAAPGSLLYPS